MTCEIRPVTWSTLDGDHPVEELATDDEEREAWWRNLHGGT
jgi:hypothetical protein